ncbi:3 beta-hydroxysteroid dehydrogenase type 7-like [Ambystoma mexicanum]|uniref:3 beta-hydroxysteroid dehydrogenase type 7-like n=1 Tax=Ambystoma mexicanum TaxID=8296 RepID=UPI0037E81514
MAADLVYLVTGGCGFLGERIVELLTKEDYISEVRAFSVVESENVKAFATVTTKVTVIKGDITEYSQLVEAMKGVNVVIHTAALLDYMDLVPFWKMKAVNVGGTENVISACCACNVPYLLYTGSISAVGPNKQLKPMLRGTEDTVYEGEPLLPYGKTKAMAEKMVLKANGQQLTNGGNLLTCVIRPGNIYGEKLQEIKDTYRATKARKGCVACLEPEGVENNFTYVGNVAWMHVLAARQLQLKPDILDGQLYYSYDDTPAKRRCLLMFDLFSHEDDSIQLGTYIPYWKMCLFINIHRIIRFLVGTFWDLKPFLTTPLLNMLVTSLSYETDKAFRHFGYRPLYSWEDSKLRVSKWLKSIKDN